MCKTVVAVTGKKGRVHTAAGLGTVDAGGRDYWEKDTAGGQTQAQVIANIMRHAK